MERSHILIIVVALILVVFLAIFGFNQLKGDNTLLQPRTPFDPGSDTPKIPLNNGSGPSPDPTPGPTPDPEPPEPEDEKLEIQPNSLMMFYFSSGGQETKILPSIVSGRESGGISDKHIYITGQPITWDTTSYAIFGHIPSLDVSYLLDKTTSYSYARKSLHVKTVENKVYTLLEQGERNPSIDEIRIKDVLSGDSVKSIFVSPGSSVGSWAIVGNSFFYHTPTTEYWSWQGTTVTKGSLYKIDLSSSSPKSQELLDSYDESNVGILYEGGDRLFSVDGEYNSDTEMTTFTVREHSTSTGKITSEITSFSAPLNTVNFYDGETALYVSVKDTSSNQYQIYKITNGEPELLFALTMEAGDTGLSNVDESNEHLILSISSSGKTPVVVYNLNTKESYEMDIERVDTRSRPEFLILNPQ